MRSLQSPFKISATDQSHRISLSVLIVLVSINFSNSSAVSPFAMRASMPIRLKATLN